MLLKIVEVPQRQAPIGKEGVDVLMPKGGKSSVLARGRNASRTPGFRCFVLKIVLARLDSRPELHSFFWPRVTTSHTSTCGPRYSGTYDVRATLLDIL